MPDSAWQQQLANALEHLRDANAFSRDISGQAAPGGMAFDSFFNPFTAWDVATNQAGRLSGDRYGAYNTKSSPNRSHADVSTFWGSDNILPDGMSAGIGAWDGPGWKNDQTIRVLDAHVDVGRYLERDGTQAYGLNADAGLFESQGGEGLEFGAASASARATVSKKGAEFGMQADGPQVAYTLSGSGTASDESIRGGYSPMGPGWAGRMHWDDQDGDGLRELGVGADVGNVSFDFTTEDPLRSAFGMMTCGLGGRQKGGADTQRNWTGEAIESVSNLFGHFAD